MRNNRMEIKISGMHCDGCARNLGWLLKRIEGVVQAEVNFKESKAELKVVPRRVSVEQLEKAVEGAGFSVVK